MSAFLFFNKKAERINHNSALLNYDNEIHLSWMKSLSPTKASGPEVGIIMHLRCKIRGREKVGGRRSEFGEIMRLRRKFGFRNSAPSAQIRILEFGIRNSEKLCKLSEATAEALYQTQSNLSECGA